MATQRPAALNRKHWKKRIFNKDLTGARMLHDTWTLSITQAHEP